MALSVANHTTDGNGVQFWDATSVYNGPGTTVLRVLVPTAPAAVPHRYLLVLPVKPGLNDNFGDGLTVIRLLNAHNTYNCTIIAPSFVLEPWIADHPTEPNYRYESFIVLDLVPWFMANFGTPTDPLWLLSFSKGGLSAFTLLSRFPALFTSAAIYDSPLVSGVDPSQPITDTSYGTQLNYDTLYASVTHLGDWASAYTSTTRLWLSGDVVTYNGPVTYRHDMDEIHTRMQALGILHHYDYGLAALHEWDAVWVLRALISLAAPVPWTAATTFIRTATAYGDSLAFLVLFQATDGSFCPQYGSSNALLAAPLTMTRATGATGASLEQAGGAGLDFGSYFPEADGAVDRTVIVWCRPDVLNAYQGLLVKDYDTGSGNDGGWGFLLTNTGRLLWHADSEKDLVDNGATLLLSTQRVMLALVWDATLKAASFYINGIFNSTQSDATITETPSGAAWLLLGKNRNQTLHAFTGAWEQVRLYTKKLTALQLAALASDPTLGWRLGAASQTLRRSFARGWLRNQN